VSTLRICVIGAGRWSSRMHLPALQKLRDAENVIFPAVCDLDRERAQRYAEQLGAEEVYTDAARMLEACRPDGVAIIVAASAAPGLVLLAAEHEVPFLVEKPPAPDAATHRRLIEATGGLRHLVAYNRRHAPYIVQAKQWMQDVRPQSVTVLFSRHRRREPDFSGTAIHAIDTARHLAGSDFASLRVEIERAEEVHNLFLSGWTRSGTRIDILITPDTASAEERYTIRAMDRTVVLSFPQPPMYDVPGYVELHEENRVKQRLGPQDFGFAADDLPSLGGILGEHTLFCRAIRAEAEVTSTLAATLQTQQVRDELRRLLEAGGRGISELAFAD